MTPDKIDVLIADDMPGTSEMIAEYLRGEGFNAVGVTNGSDVRRWFAASPDFFVTDLAMFPDPGDRLAIEAKAAIPGVRVYFNTAADNLDLPMIAQSCGVEGWFSKPNHLDEIRDRLRSPRPDPRISPAQS